MIYAFDTYYFEDKARTACVAFKDWTDESPAEVYIRFREDVEEYESGNFFAANCLAYSMFWRK